MGKRNDFGFLSLSSSFLVFEFFFRCCCWKLFLNETTKTKEGGEREFCSLSLSRTKNIFENISQMAKKKKKSILSSRKKIFSLCSLCLKGGRASSLLRRRRRHHQPSLWNTEQHEKKESREQHEDAKIPTSGGERKCCWAFYWSREVCVCARFPPLISLRKAYLLVSSFDNFSSFWWENCPSETFLFSLIFFSVVSERRERRGGKINTKNHYGASTSSVDDSLYVILFFRRKEE